MKNVLYELGKARVRNAYDIGKLLKTHGDRVIAKHELKLTDGQIGLFILLTLYDFELYEDCISLSSAKNKYNSEQDRRRKQSKPTGTAEQAEATLAKNAEVDYDYIDA